MGQQFLVMIGTEVHTSDGESLGKITKVNEKYFTTWKSGLVTDEEYRIPLNAMSNAEATNSSYAVRLSLNANQVRHGYEFVTERPNSEIVRGSSQSAFRIPSEKPVIRFEAMGPTEENSSISNSKGLSSRIEYSCDQCETKFATSDMLQKHRSHEHKAPVGI